MTNVTMRLNVDAAMGARLRDLAERQDRTPQHIVRQALAAYIEKAEAPAEEPGVTRAAGGAMR